MTSRHVIMGHATSTGCSVTRFVSRSRQPLFANNVAGTARLTAPRLSVAKTGGLSDTPGAERSTGDTVTYVLETRLCVS